ncbi:MAG TPA: 3'-5' exonuclease [Candidatus Nanoarchaeia archaeon]|nr:3'-5' exonuclease [Candidatus Nanoarchaeia archaeon]
MSEVSRLLILQKDLIKLIEEPIEEEDMHNIPTFNVVDLETTNLSPNVGGEVAEIAIIKVIGNQVKDVYHKFYSIKSISDKAAERNGLSVDLLKGFPSFNTKEVIKEVKEVLGEHPIYAHSAAFEHAFLEFYGATAPNHVYIDTLKLCRESRNKLVNNQLSTWTSTMKITHRPHGALSDAIALTNLILLMGWQINLLDIVGNKK